MRPLLLLLPLLFAGCETAAEGTGTVNVVSTKTCDCTPCRCNPCKCSPNQPAIEPTPDLISTPSADTPPVGEVYYGVDNQWHFIHADTRQHVTYKRLSCSRKGCTWGWR